MVDNEYQQILPKISGYLEKKGRKKMMSCYKKYWFVLEGRLLLYYKSKDEYEAISPCKGSINLGPTCSVKPGTSNTGVFQIESKTNTITLRAESKDDQHKWMEALMSALNQRNEYRKLDHFRYSTSDLSPIARRALESKVPLSQSFDTGSVDFQMSIIEKLQKMGAKSYGIGPKLRRSKTILERQISCSNEVLPLSYNDKLELRLQKTGSLIVDNDCYNKVKIRNSVESVGASSECIYERIPSSDAIFGPRGSQQDKVNANNNKSATLITDNDIYWSQCVNGKTKRSSEPCYEAIDYNDNSIQLGRIGGHPEENIYAVADDMNGADELENREYIDIDKLKNNSVSSEDSNEGKDRKSGMFVIGKKKKDSNKGEEKKVKIKKSQSFLQRVWSKKSGKKKKTEISLSENNIVNKIEMSDNETLQTLSELKNILQRQNSLTKRLDDRTSTVSAMELSCRGDMECYENDVFERNTSYTASTQEMGYHNLKGPSLPPRNRSKTTRECSLPMSSVYKELPKKQAPAVPPKMKKRFVTAEPLSYDNNKAKDNALDEMLKQEEEIENDMKEGKVRALIKKFSKETIASEEGVELRHKDSGSRSTSEASPTDSKDLDKLLEELAKITTAPIMTPGVTISLINPEISDKEIQKMAPNHRRRMSDPDYDVPRPHRSLVNIRHKRDENALQATRFFGPILKPSDFEACGITEMQSTPPTDYHSNVPSMTPDSLEMNYQKTDSTQSQSHDELRTVSYESHDYLHYHKASHHNLTLMPSLDCYSDPRLLFKAKNGFSPDSQDVISIHQKSDNFFVDSLDP